MKLITTHYLEKQPRHRDIFLILTESLEESLYIEAHLKHKAYSLFVEDAAGQKIRIMPFTPAYVFLPENDAENTVVFYYDAIISPDVLDNKPVYPGRHFRSRFGALSKHYYEIENIKDVTLV